MSEIDLLIKLFDTLKDASKETQQLCHAMLTNQNNIGNYMKSLPMDDLKQALKDHSKESTDEIGTCTETVESKSDNILERVKAIEGKIGKMILVVIVAFTLFTTAILIANFSNPHSQAQDRATIEDLQKIIDADKIRTDEVIEDLRKTVEEFHNKK